MKLAWISSIWPYCVTLRARLFPFSLLGLGWAWCSPVSVLGRFCNRPGRIVPIFAPIVLFCNSHKISYHSHNSVPIILNYSQQRTLMSNLTFLAPSWESESWLPLSVSHWSSSVTVSPPYELVVARSVLSVPVLVLAIIATYYSYLTTCARAMRLTARIALACWKTRLLTMAPIWQQLTSQDSLVRVVVS